jgi:hypothetical protein
MSTFIFTKVVERKKIINLKLAINAAKHGFIIAGLNVYTGWENQQSLTRIMLYYVLHTLKTTFIQYLF